MRYALAKAKSEANASAYRYYVADSLYLMARREGPSMRLHELLNPKPEETRTAEEIIDGIKDKLRQIGGE